MPDAPNSSSAISKPIAELLARGFAVVALDWRGQGLSERQLRNPRKGHIDDFEIYERDLVALREQILDAFVPEALVRARP